LKSPIARLSPVGASRIYRIRCCVTRRTEAVEREVRLLSLQVGTSANFPNRDPFDGVGWGREDLEREKKEIHRHLGSWEGLGSLWKSGVFWEYDDLRGTR